MQIYGKVQDDSEIQETPEVGEQRLLNWIIVIADVCIDYDGYNSVDGLKSLIDDIRAMTQLAIQGAEPYISE